MTDQVGNSVTVFGDDGGRTMGMQISVRRTTAGVIEILIGPRHRQMPAFKTTIELGLAKVLGRHLIELAELSSTTTNERENTNNG